MKSNVLIVDDSLTVRMDLADAFESAGLQPVLCANIADARIAMSAQAIDLFILDVLLPDGDGIDLMRDIRNRAATAELPILMLSTEADVKDRLRGMRTGADDYVGKPYDSAYVVMRGRELLRQHQEPPPEAGAERATLLVIDDSVTFREELRCALEQSGYTVITATSGEKGLRLAATVRPTAIIVDSVMPGMDGATVIRRLRFDAALRGMPCLMLTAAEDAGAELRALDAGADAFVRKEESMDVILARVAALIRSARAEPQAAASLTSPKRILAVDDSMTYLQELAAALRDEGYDVVLAHSGEQAIEVLAVQEVDCILLDIMMPGIGGHETCRRLKASNKMRHTPVIMLTAVDDELALIEGLSTGADDYIAKSHEFNVLRARIQAQLRRKQFEDEHRGIRDRLLRSELEAAEARAARQLAETKAEMVEELRYKNKELEAFSYSVSHDLRGPLRSLDGFSQALLEDYGPELDETAQNYLNRIRSAAQRMGALIDDLLQLSRIGRSQVTRDRIDLSELAETVADELRRQQPEREVSVIVEPGIQALADRGLMRVLFDNLFGNAWKFTGRTEHARIEFGSTEGKSGLVFHVKDNGAGFDMKHMSRLFLPFQRLHSDSDFPGTGIGLATARRVIDHHSGNIWAESTSGQGATIFFTLPRRVALLKDEERNDDPIG